MVSAHALEWMALELMRDCDGDIERVPTPYSLASDVFAFAMMVIEVCPDTSDACAAAFLIHIGLYEAKPFASKKCGDVLRALRKHKRPRLPAFIHEQAEFASLIERCWGLNPESRPLADVICKVLECVILIFRGFTRSLTINSQSHQHSKIIWLPPDESLMSLTQHEPTSGPFRGPRPNGSSSLRSAPPDLHPLYFCLSVDSGFHCSWT